VMAEREFLASPDDRLENHHRAGWWTGDVWRCALLLKRCRPELRTIVLDAFPTGLMLITNLDPSSTMLRERYASAIETMHAMSLRELTLPGLHAELNVEPTSGFVTAEHVRQFS
jgi:hypothetical protein